jgi:hypothetical protein
VIKKRKYFNNTIPIRQKGAKPISMKVIVFNKGKYGVFHTQFHDFLHMDSGERERKYATRKTGNLLESIPRTEYPCGVVFDVENAEMGCAFCDDLPGLFNVQREQIFVEVRNGIYYSGWLADEQFRQKPFRILPSWDFRKALVFREGILVFERKMLPEEKVSVLNSIHPETDKILEIWFTDWEFFDKFLIRYSHDYGEACFWPANNKSWDQYGIPIDVDRLPLSEKTKDRVRELCKWFDTCVDWSNPGGDSPWSNEERKKFSTESCLLFEDLQKELGDEYKIIRRN